MFHRLTSWAYHKLTSLLAVRDLLLLRFSKLFDKDWYLSMNPDVAASKMNPYLHYLNFGWLEGRDPCPNFSVTGYLESFPDVKKTGINPLLHYLKFGKREGRKIVSKNINLICARGESFPSAPDFLIVGAQKAGTTALYSYLAQHPNILATEKKEHHFFNCDKNYIKGSRFYCNLFPQKEANQFVFDASPGYLVDYRSPVRICNYNPRIKMIAILRNPVDRAYSAWQMYKIFCLSDRDWYYKSWICDNEKIYKRRTDDALFSFAAFVEEELLFLDQGVDIEMPILNHGFYADQLKRFFKVFDREQMLIIDNKRLREHTYDVLCDIQNFIGIQHYDFLVESLVPVFSGNYSETMEDDMKTFLTNFYRQYNNELFELLEIETSWW